MFDYNKYGESFNIVFARSLQTTLSDSLLGVLRKILNKEPQAAPHWEAGAEYFRARNAPINGVLKGTNANAEEIKGTEDVKFALFDEANTATEFALGEIVPTFARVARNKRIYIFNPSIKSTPIAQRLIRDIGEENLYKDCKVGKVVARWVNWDTNDFLSQDGRDFIAKEKKDISRSLFDNRYGGYFREVQEGVYYTNELADMYAAGRYQKLIVDYQAPYYATFDLGLNDLCTCWIFQVERDRVNILRYFAWAGTKFSDVLDDIAVKGFAKPVIVLPHDGDDQRGYSTLATPETDARRRGLQVIVVPRVKSKMHRIDAVRNVLPHCWFDNIYCDNGLAEIKQYAPKIVNGIPLDSPDHKHSDAADALGGIPYIYNRANVVSRLDFSGVIFN
ncbi:hypothetical protein DPQ22_00515 [Candidatus Tokpelaia sp.]|nr:hypothetical protein DPQ22_00515 [Candidatus Tokpelaia sp.]